MQKNSRPYIRQDGHRDERISRGSTLLGDAQAHESPTLIKEALERLFSELTDRASTIPDSLSSHASGYFSPSSIPIHSFTVSMIIPNRSFTVKVIVRGVKIHASPSDRESFAT